MTNGHMVVLAIQSVIFVYWAFLMFRTIFGLRKRIAARTGAAIPGPFETLKEYKTFLTAPDDRKARNQLGIATLLVFVSIAVSTYFGGPQ